jgi:FkbM family methyltransferase
MNITIFYGIIGDNINITDVCFDKLINNNIIRIPSDDYNRAKIFTDPLVGVHKYIIINIDDIITEYDDKVIIYINTLTKQIKTKDVDLKLKKIHNELKINHGSFNEEVPEQKMVVSYLTGNEKVLELGANIGRNSLVIGYILKKINNNNYVTLECDKNICSQLTENRNINNMSFNIENSALSKKKLIQKGWDTIPSDELLEGYQNVDVISWEELKNKYQINFDTLVIDCEGAFYYILMDMPEILENINLIIMENDYWDLSHKNYIDYILTNNNFVVDYSEEGGWGPCFNNFFEVWKRVTPL